MLIGGEEGEFWFNLILKYKKVTLRKKDVKIKSIELCIILRKRKVEKDFLSKWIKLAFLQTAYSIYNSLSLSLRSNRFIILSLYLYSVFKDNFYFIITNKYHKL